MSNWTEEDFANYSVIDWKLFKEIKFITDENLDNPKILQHAYELSLIALGLSMSSRSDKGVDALVMNLHEYVGERLAIANGKQHDDSWAKEFGAPVNQFIKYGEKRFKS